MSVGGREFLKIEEAFLDYSCFYPPLANFLLKIFNTWAWIKEPRQSPTKPHEERKREWERVRASAREAEPFLSHSFDSQFTHRSQPGGRDFEEERSVARLNLKCQMLYFDFMEKRQFRGPGRPHATRHFSLLTWKNLRSNRYRLALSPSWSKTTRCLSPEGQWYLIIKLPPIRALGEVIYFAYVKEGAKLHEPFPHTLTEISSRAALAPQRERGILKG